MGHMGNVAHGAIVYRGYGVQGYSPDGPWGTWAMGAHGVWATWAMWTQGKWGTGGVGHMASEAHRGKGVQGVWDT